MKALSTMKQSGTSGLMVVEAGRLVGIIALKDLLELLSLKVELEQWRAPRRSDAAQTRPRHIY
jgi:CBS domain-containing protein